jgi:hypothetical protein
MQVKIVAARTTVRIGVTTVRIRIKARTVRDIGNGGLWLTKDVRF